MKTYRLYIWKHAKIASRAEWVRGKCVGEFPRYFLLVREAERRAVAAGYPKSRWPDLFDWNV